MPGVRSNAHKADVEVALPLAIDNKARGVTTVDFLPKQQPIRSDKYLEMIGSL